MMVKFGTVEDGEGGGHGSNPECDNFVKKRYFGRISATR